MIIEMSGDTFANNLRYLRKKYELSRQALAKLIGISAQTLKNIETGTVYPALDIKAFRRLCEVFQVDANDLAQTDLSVPKS